MPEQSQKIQTDPAPNPDPPSPGDERKPSVRTMKSDVEELFKTTKPSLIQLVEQEVSGKKFERAEEKRRSGEKYYYLIAGAAIFAFLGIGAYLFFFQRRPPPAEEIKLVPPAPFFATETSRTISAKTDNRGQFLRLVEDSMREQERDGTIKRLLIKLQDRPAERFASLGDFLNFYRINAPQKLLERLDDKVMFFIYNSGKGNRIGFAARIRDPDRTWRDFIAWENSLLSDLQPLFFDERPEVIVAPFEDRTYRNIDWRFLKLSQKKDLGIGYTIFPAGNILLLTFGKEAMETAISRLLER